MLDRERADFFRALGQMQEQLSERCVAVHLPIGSEHELTGIVDILHMCAYTSPEGGKEAEPGPIPDEMAELVAEYREKLLDEVVQTDEALMEKYLEGEELGVEEVAHALKDAVTRGEVFPVACGIATKNLGTHALLDLIVEGVPSPAKAGSITHIEGAETAAFVFKTIADPFAGRINLFRVLQGSVKPDQTLVDARTHAKERMGSLLFQQGKEHIPAEEFGPGDIGAVAKLKEVQTGDLLLDKEVATRRARDRLPRAGDELRRHAEVEGRRGEGRDGDPPARRGGPDPAPAARPADRGGDPLRDEPDARRGRARAREAALRRRRRAAPAARAVPRDDPEGVARRTRATRSRRAVAASSATARSCSSRSTATSATSSSTRSSAA